MASLTSDVKKFSSVQILNATQSIKHKGGDISGPKTETPVVTTVADSASDISAAGIVTGVVNVTGGGADTFTLPTGIVLANAMPGAVVVVGQTLKCVVINDSGGTLTFAAGATGSTITNTSADLTVEDTELAILDIVWVTATKDAEAYYVLLHKST